VALVTGAARGQGRAEAVRLAEEGADVIAVDICAHVPSTRYDGTTEDDLRTTVELVEKAGARVVSAVVDIRDYDRLAEVVAAGVRELGRLDVVVANAGVVTYGRLWELTPEEFHEVMDINVTGTWHTIRATVPTLIEQGRGGVILITSSVAGLRGLPFLGHYVASKHAVAGMAKTLSNELVEYGIRVVSIHPAGVRTPMNDTCVFGFAELAERHPGAGGAFTSSFREASEPEEIAELVAFVASNGARHISGSQIVVDAGALA
jgi:SDR family mycofactocin-dependent oxidoreductase